MKCPSCRADNNLEWSLSYGYSGYKCRNCYKWHHYQDVAEFNKTKDERLREYLAAKTYLKTADIKLWAAMEYEFNEAVANKDRAAVRNLLQYCPSSSNVERRIYRQLDKMDKE